jgi:hypothetical protein
MKTVVKLILGHTLRRWNERRGREKYLLSNARVRLSDIQERAARLVVDTSRFDSARNRFLVAIAEVPQSRRAETQRIMDSAVTEMCTASMEFAELATAYASSVSPKTAADTTSWVDRFGAVFNQLTEAYSTADTVCGLAEDEACRCSPDVLQGDTDTLASSLTDAEALIRSIEALGFRTGELCDGLRELNRAHATLPGPDDPGSLRTALDDLSRKVPEAMEGIELGDRHARAVLDAKNTFHSALNQARDRIAACDDADQKMVRKANARLVQLIPTIAEFAERPARDSVSAEWSRLCAIREDIDAAVVWVVTADRSKKKARRQREREEADRKRRARKEEEEQERQRRTSSFGAGVGTGYVLGSGSSSNSSSSSSGSDGGSFGSFGGGSSGGGSSGGGSFGGW